MLIELKPMFDKALRDLFPLRPELGRWLVKHERKELCLKNLSREVWQAERKLGGKFLRPQLETMVKHVARFFAHNAIKEQEEKLLTEGEKSRLKSIIEKTPEQIRAELADEGVIVEELKAYDQRGSADHSGPKGPGLHGLSDHGELKTLR